jgi:hypothetical protein
MLIYLALYVYVWEAGSTRGLTNISLIRCVDTGTPIPGEEKLEADLEVNRLVGAWSNLLVLRVKGDRVSDLRERRLWRTPECPRTRQTIGGMPMHDRIVASGPDGGHIPPSTIQRGLALNVGVTRRRRRHSSALRRWLALRGEQA